MNEVSSLHAAAGWLDGTTYLTNQKPLKAGGILARGRIHLLLHRDSVAYMHGLKACHNDLI